jgi:hypothetical protein
MKSDIDRFLERLEQDEEEPLSRLAREQIAEILARAEWPEAVDRDGLSVGVRRLLVNASLAVVAERSLRAAGRLDLPLTEVLLAVHQSLWALGELDDEDDEAAWEGALA